VAIVGLLIFMFVVELTLLGLVPDVGKFTPINGITAAIAETDVDEDDLLSVGAALAVMAGWITVLFAAAAALLRRRDLT
jgi:alkylhydroperoxidase/carboxymuconolactone decarboxylase family protein YurZ